MSSWALIRSPSSSRSGCRTPPCRVQAATLGLRTNLSWVNTLEMKSLVINWKKKPHQQSGGGQEGWLLHLVFSFSVFMFTSPPALELEFVLTAYKDKRLTLDLDQNQGLPPITHSILFTITLDFKSLEFGYTRIQGSLLFPKIEFFINADFRGLNFL